MSIQKSVLSKELDGIEEESRFSNFPLDINTQIEEVDPGEKVYWEEEGYCVKISSCVNSEQYGTEVTFQKTISVYTLNKMLFDSLRMMKEEIWQDIIMEANE